MRPACLRRDDDTKAQLPSAQDIAPTPRSSTCSVQKAEHFTQPKIRLWSLLSQAPDQYRPFCCKPRRGALLKAASSPKGLLAGVQVLTRPSVRSIPTKKKDQYDGI